jgi:hypothetical protein
VVLRPFFMNLSSSTATSAPFIVRYGRSLQSFSQIRTNSTNSDDEIRDEPVTSLPCCKSLECRRPQKRSLDTRILWIRNNQTMLPNSSCSEALVCSTRLQYGVVCLKRCIYCHRRCDGDGHRQGLGSKYIENTFSVHKYNMS